MNDLTRLKHTFDILQIPYNIYKDVTDISLYLEAGNGDIKGYSGFICKFTFDLEGNKIEAGVWE